MNYYQNHKSIEKNSQNREKSEFEKNYKKRIIDINTKQIIEDSNQIKTLDDEFSPVNKYEKSQNPIQIEFKDIKNENLNSLNNQEINIKNEKLYKPKQLFSKYSENVEIIYHISDLNLDPHQKTFQEYNYIFDQLFTVIEQDKNPNKILIIIGDLLNNNPHLTSESIVYIWSLLKKFNSILPIICIPGNLESNLNDEKLDNLIGIFFDRLKEGMEIHYLLENGLFHYRNILFCYQSKYNQEIIIPKKINTNSIKIALYHGILFDLKSSFSFTLPKSRSIKDFIDYDYSLLGGDHQFKLLEKNIAYSGSLFTQNYQEGHYQHGTIKWNIKKNEIDFIEIKNNFSYNILYYDHKMKLIKVNNNYYEINNLSNNIIPKYGNIKIIIEDKLDDLEIYKEIKSYIIRKIKNYSPIIKINFENEINYNSYEEKLNKLLNKYLNEKKYESQNEILNYFQTKQIIRKSNNHKPWEIISIKWNNIFLFGEFNELNFDKCKKIIAVIGNNSSGKSNLIDIIIYLLYGKEKLKNNKFQDIINNNKTHFLGQIKIKIHDKYLIIKRKGEKHFSKINDNCELSLFSIINKCEEKIMNTNKLQTIINDYLGDFNDFKNYNFFVKDMKEKTFTLNKITKKNFINNYLEINFFEEQYKQINQELKELYIKQIDLNSKIKIDSQFLQTKIKNNEMTIDFLNERKNKLSKNKLENENLISKLNTNKKNRILNLLSEETIKNDKHKFELLCKQTNEEIETIKKNNINFTYYDKKISEKQIEIDILKKNLNEKQHLENIQKIKKNFKKEKIKNSMKTITSDINLINNIFNKIANNQIIDKSQLKQINISLYDKFDKRYKQIDQINLDLKKIQNEQIEINDKINKINLEKNSLIEEQKIYLHLNSKIKDFEIKIIEIEEMLFINEQINKDNELIEIDISEIEKKQNEIRVEINDISNELNLTENQRNDAKKKLKEFEEAISDIKLLTPKINIYEILEEIISGFSKYIIDYFLKKIENEINNLFFPLFDKNISLILENEILQIRTISNNNKFNFTMGHLESSIFQLLFMVSISKIKNSKNCNILFIDYFFNFDHGKIPAIKLLFSYLLSYYNKIVIISNDEILKNIADEKIIIYKNNLGESVLKI